MGLMQDRFFFREYVKSGHESQEKHGKCSERDPNAGEIYADRRGLVLVDARSFRRAAGQFECVPDFPSVHVFADRPGDFLVERFAGKDARRMNIICDESFFSDANLPGKFAENEIGVRVSSLKMLVALAYKRPRLAERAGRDGRAALRKIERPRLRLGRPWERRSSHAHHQPSKLRRFFNLRSSNSTNSPRYKEGSGSL